MRADVLFLPVVKLRQGQCGNAASAAGWIIAFLVSEGPCGDFPNFIHDLFSS
jgi:hypothetical protein